MNQNKQQGRGHTSNCENDRGSCCPDREVMFDHRGKYASTQGVVGDESSWITCWYKAASVSLQDFLWEQENNSTLSVTLHKTFIPFNKCQ